jgi:hypothetical protein
MRVIDLRGREVSWNLKGYEVRRDDDTPVSSLHLRAREVIRDAYPTDRILEEVEIPGTRMRADFFVPSRWTMFEVQGSQHFEHSAHLHGSYGGFVEARRRDRRKVRFCELNDITLIELRYDESDEQWRRKILDA